MSFDLVAPGETITPSRPLTGVDPRRVSLLLDHAGADSNTAVGLARLGLRVAWISCLGDDAAGTRILDAFSKEGGLLIIRTSLTPLSASLVVSSRKAGSRHGVPTE